MLGKTSLMKRCVILVLLVFGLLLGAARAQTESVLYSFCTQGCTDGADPYTAPVVVDQKGNLYGTTYYGGVDLFQCSPDGCGVVFKVTPEGKETVLYSFCKQNNCPDGAWPVAGLVLDQKGNLYGTTFNGGRPFGKGCPTDGGCGVVFKVTPEGKETVLHRFCAHTKGDVCTDGAFPKAGLIFDQKGNLYGTAITGGAMGGGVVFKITPEGKETVLYSFCVQTNCADGAGPEAGLIFDQKGNLYGTTNTGGAHNSRQGGGAVFKITPEGKETVLYSFCAQTNCADGSWPVAGLVFDQKGNLYGTTSVGGAYDGCYPGGSGCGVAFKLTPEGRETVLYSFCAQGGDDCTDGTNPSAGLIFDQKGDLYGTTGSGGNNNNGYCLGGCGVVFKLTPRGKETVLYGFCAQGGCPDGAHPGAGLIFGQKGNLYGTTGNGGAYSRGEVFKLKP
jgi:uncharacterized repeat protein (TIGR03803 family)